MTHFFTQEYLNLSPYNKKYNIGTILRRCFGLEENQVLEIVFNEVSVDFWEKN